MHPTSCRVVSLILMVLMSGCSTLSKDVELDPYDMENFDPSSNTMHGKVKKKTPREDTKPIVKEKLPAMPVINEDKTITMSNKGGNSYVCRQESSPCQSLFRQYVKTLLYHIKGKVYGGAEELNLRLMTTEADVEFLAKFTDSSGADKDVRHVHEILSSMIKLASEVQHGEPTVHRLWVESLFGMPLEKLVMLIALALIVGLFFGAANKFHFSWQKLAIKMVFFLFVLSVFWQWYELYKKEEARQHMTIMKEMPEQCRKREKEESFGRTLYLTLRSMVTFENDECLQYYEHMLIDPFWKVTPTLALAKTVVRFFVSPAREIGEAVQELLTGTLKGLPVQLWPVALTSIGVFSFLLLFMSFGYRFSLPFGFMAIEPGQRGDNSKVLKVMEQQNEQLLKLQQSQKQEMKQLQETMRQDLEHQLQKILSLPGIFAPNKSEVSQAFPALQDCEANAVFDSATSASKALPETFKESQSLQELSSLKTTEIGQKPAISSKSATVLSNESVGDSENIVSVPEDCSAEHVKSVNSCAEQFDTKVDSTESMALKNKKDLDLAEEEKGHVVDTNISGQSSSFEEISVSNIEAIGKRDNRFIHQQLFQAENSDI